MIRIGNMKPTIIVRNLLLLLFSIVATVSPAPQHNESPSHWADLATSTTITALDTATAADLLADYVRTAFLDRQDPLPTEPCFMKERENLDSQALTITEYSEHLAEDYDSVADYQEYLGLVAEERRLVYRTPFFQDLKTNMDQLESSLQLALCSLVESGYLDTTALDFCTASSTTTNSMVGMGGEEGGEGAGDGPEHCRDTRYSYQYYMYLRIISLVDYITADVHGIRDALAMN